MEIDKTTLKDLSIFHPDDDQSILNLLNNCITVNGREQLRMDMVSPLRSVEEVKQVQEVIAFIGNRLADMPMDITNGTVMVIEKYYNSNLAAIPADATPMSVKMYQLTNGPDFSLIKYSMQHFFDFFRSMHMLLDNLDVPGCPSYLKEFLDEIKMLTNRPVIEGLRNIKSAKEMGMSRVLRLANFSLHQHKRAIHRLLEIHAQLDAWYGVAVSAKKYNYVFPDVNASDEPYFEAKDLYHPLVMNYVSYDVELNKHKNFLFLTGANMAGKSTFIKAVGIAAYLAHLGFPVPAARLNISFFFGLLSNINVMDNVIKGESYFFNEVQRIKSTINKIKDGKPWLVLIDELFKGTNVQDAMKCSSVVIEGLLKMHSSLFILSTHLYEI